MNCPSCGAEIAAGGTFCGRCGTRVEAAPASGYSINIDADGQGRGTGYSYQIEHQPAFSLAGSSCKRNNRSWPRPAPWFLCPPTSNCSRR